MLKELFVSKNGSNIIYEGEIYYYLIIKAIRTDKNQIVCAFDGHIRKEKGSEQRCISELLIEYIQEHGTAYLDPCVIARFGAPQKRVEEVLYSLYNDKSIEDAAKLNIKLVNRKKKISISSTSAWCDIPTDEIELFKNNHVYDMSNNNLISNEKYSCFHTNGGFVGDGNAIIGGCKGRKFYTNYDKKLLTILKKIRPWNLDKRGALVATVARGKHIPFSTIVWAYHHGLIPHDTDATSTINSIVAVHRHFLLMGLEVDHLTENVQHNFLYGLVLMQGDINSSFQTRRKSIKQPFYFLSVYNHNVGKLLVKCGIDTDVQHYERRFAFRLDSKGETAYRDCFAAFEKKVKSVGYLTKEPEKDNLLSYWASPERACSADNELKAMLEYPLNTYTAIFAEWKKSGQNFDDMPIID